MQPFPQLQTERLLLSRLTANDIPQIIHLAANKHISDYTLNLPFPYQENDAIFWLNLANQGFKNGTHLILAVRQKGNHSFISGIGLTIEQRFNRAEIGYWLGEPFWNQSYMSEATKVLIRFGFNTLGLHKLTSSHLALNPASGKVMQKCSMKKEGELEDHICKDSVYHTLILYGLTKRDYDQIG